MTMIIPAILTDKFQEFSEQTAKLEGLFPYYQLDVMDGKFVSSKSFTEIEKISSVSELPIELHLMVDDPVEEMRKWRSVDNVFRVIFHLEAPTDPLRSISFARKEGWDIGLALNPDTQLDKAATLLNKIDLLQFMTVYPGKHGAEFQEKVIEKIKEFRITNKLMKCSVDGGINRETIKKLKNIKVDYFNVGSALIYSDNIKDTKNELLELVN